MVKFTMRRWFALALVGVMSTSCAVTRSYMLPIKPEQNEQIMTGLISCAHSKGYSSNRMDDVFDVTLSPSMHVRFGMELGEQFAMAVLLDSNVPANEQEKMLQQGKTAGDALLSCAQQTDMASSPAVVPETASNMPSHPPQSVSGTTCQQLQQCYVELSKALCQTNQMDCQHQFEVESVANHPVCVQMMAALPATIAPFKIAYPNFVMPTSCMVSSATPMVDAAVPAMVPQQPTNNGSKNPKGNKNSNAAMNNGNNPAAQQMNWQGNWMVKANYQWTCIYPLTQPEKGKDDGAWSLTIQGQGNQVEGIVTASGQEYALKGAISSTGVRLCGAFPFKGKGGNIAPNRDNNVCLSISNPEQSTEQTVGTAEGDFETRFGHRCKVADVQLELSR